MEEKYNLIGIGELHDGEMKEVSTEGKHFLVALVGNKFYVTDGRCPHMGGKLAMGKLEGTIVTCPVHGSRFDLVDGRVIRWTNWTGVLSNIAKTLRSPRPLKCYQPLVEGDRLFITV